MKEITKVNQTKQSNIIRGREGEGEKKKKKCDKGGGGGVRVNGGRKMIKEWVARGWEKGTRTRKF